MHAVGLYYDHVHGASRRLKSRKVKLSWAIRWWLVDFQFSGRFCAKSSGERKPNWLSGTVASLGWVTTGAATEGVTPLFPEKPGDILFAHRCHYHYRFLLLSLGCHPLQGVTPHLCLPVQPSFATILCKFAHKIFFPSGVTPGTCHPGRSAPPPSDATARVYSRLQLYKQKGYAYNEFHTLLFLSETFNFISGRLLILTSSPHACSFGTENTALECRNVRPMIDEQWRKFRGEI